MNIINLWTDKPLLDEKYIKYADEMCTFFQEEYIKGYGVNRCELKNIEIETINRCNNDCAFCPVNIHNDKREPLKMSEPLFKKVIQELALMGYSRTISLYSNNEPLLDTRIYDFVKYVKKMLPKAKQTLYTNGLLLDEKKCEKLIEHVDVLVIDIYSEINQIPNEFTWLKKLNVYNENIKPVLRNKKQILTTRGGNAPNAKSNYKCASFCTYPFFQMVVRPDGKISKCCHDAYGEETLGDLNNGTISEIWNSHIFSDFRKNMLNRGRTSCYSCKNCDVLLYNCNLFEDDKNLMKRHLIDLILLKKKQGRNIYICGEINKKAAMTAELESHNIRYIELHDQSKNRFAEDSQAYLLADYFSHDALYYFIKKGKLLFEDFIVYFRCF